MPLINCEIELNWRWAKKIVISEISRTPEVEGANPVDETLTTGAVFQINNAKLFVPVVTLSINDNINFLENIKEGFKRTISWNNYRSEIVTQTKNNNLDYLIDPTFRNINRLFVLSFKNCNDDSTRDSFDEYYMPLVEIKDFNALIDDKTFFDQPGKKKQEVHEKLVEMSRKNDHITGNLLDYLYHQKYCKLIDIDLSRQINTSIPQQINFTGKLEKDDGATKIFIAEKLF